MEQQAHAHRRFLALPRAYDVIVVMMSPPVSSMFFRQDRNLENLSALLSQFSFATIVSTEISEPIRIPTITPIIYYIDFCACS